MIRFSIILHLHNLFLPLHILEYLYSHPNLLHYHLPLILLFIIIGIHFTHSYTIIVKVNKLMASIIITIVIVTV